MLLKILLILFDLLLFSQGFPDEPCMPPQIKKPQGPLIIHKPENTTFNVQCSAVGLPLPDYTWKKGEIGDSKALSRDVFFNSNTGVLTFKSLSETDEGVYYCFATNRFDGPGGRAFAVSISSPLTIKTIGFKSLTPHSEVTELEGLEYEYLKVPCRNMVAGEEQVVYYWFAENRDLRIPLDERMYIDKRGNLHISYLLKKDEHLVFCGFYMDGNFKYSLAVGDSYKLKIFPAPQVPDIAPHIEYSENVIGKLYHSAILECFFSGFHPQYNMTIIWFLRDGKQIQSDEKYYLAYGNRSLTVKNLVEDDEGSFFCRAILGSKTTRNKEVFLEVTSKPIFIDGAPNDITVTQGEDVTIPCRTRSTRNRAPPSSPAWYVNGQKLGSLIDSSKFVITDDSLTVKSVKKPEDIMCIACVVSNTYGQTMGQACLNVLLPINVTHRPKEEIVIDPHLGGVLNFTVTATTDASQKLIYKWVFFSTIEEQSREGTLPNFTYYDDASHVALINLTERVESDYTNFIGSYRLNLSNFYEFRLLEVRVLMKPQSHALAQLGTNYWIIGLVIGILTFIGAIMSTLIIVWRRQRKGDYNVDKRDRKAGLDPENELKTCRFSEYSRPGCSEDPDLRPDSNLVSANMEFDAEDNSLSEYSNDAATQFNEDGSFIGTYR